jgi:iron complex transport system permease protein
VTAPARRPALVVLPWLAVLLAAICVFAVKTGQVEVTWSGLAALVAGEDGKTAGGGSLKRIVFGLRLPRVLLGAAVGASLAAAGAVFQGVLRNPLADPFLLGLSGGASLGAAVVLLGGAGSLHVLVLPAAAMAGALLALVVVSRLASGSGSTSPTTLILAGVMVSAFCSAAVMFLTAVSPSARVHGTLLWMMGSLAAPPPGLLPFVLGAACLGVAYLSLSGHHLNVLSLGEETAQQIGVEAETVRWRLLFAASLLTAVSVAASGLIGFVGLVVPHALRSLAGADHRFLVPASALAGGAALVLADCGARTFLPPVEIPVGVITALFGAPFFLVLLRRRKGWMR